MPSGEATRGGKSGGGKSGGGDGEKKPKATIIDLGKYIDKPVRVKFAGGRECSGILKGYDALLNLVLDATSEYLRDPEDPYKLTGEAKLIGLTVCRGTSVVLICGADSMEQIENPFVQQE